MPRSSVPSTASATGEAPAPDELGVTKVLDATEPSQAEEEGHGEGEDEGEEEAAPDEAELQALYEALREGDQGVIDGYLLGDEEHPPLTGFGVNSTFEAGMTPLHWLTAEGHASVCAHGICSECAAAPPWSTVHAERGECETADVSVGVGVGVGVDGIERVRGCGRG